MLTGRGLVFVAEILEGTVSINNLIYFYLLDKHYHLLITSVEGVLKRDAQGNALPLIGLLIRANEQETREIYKNPQIQGVVAEIYSEVE